MTERGIDIFFVKFVKTAKRGAENLGNSAKYQVEDR